MLLVVNVPLAGASAWLRGSLFGRALQSSKSLCRGGRPGEARRGIYRCIGITNTARSDDLRTIFADWSAAADWLVRVQSRELALKVDSTVFIRVYISTLLGSLKTGAYGSA